MFEKSWLSSCRIRLARLPLSCLFLLADSRSPSNSPRALSAGFGAAPSTKDILVSGRRGLLLCLNIDLRAIF